MLRSIIGSTNLNISIVVNASIDNAEMISSFGYADYMIKFFVVVIVLMKKDEIF